MAEAAAETQTAKPPKPKFDLLCDRWGALELAYNKPKARHEEIGEYVAPDRTSFTTQAESSKGGRRDQKILDATATDSAGKLTAAIETGVFSPAREWARITTTLGEDVATEYLYDVQKKFFYVMAKSNLYKGLGSITRDDVEFGTGVLWMESDPVTVVRGTHFPVGSYRIATNDRGQVDTVYRRFEMTTGQMVRKFGKAACSFEVQQEWDQEKYDCYHWVQHSCEPRTLREYGKIDKKNKPWQSCWLEISSKDKKLLEESGFDKKPFICIRWDYVGQNPYGIGCPAMQSIGDTKQLQDFTTAGASAVAQIIKPALNVPAGLNASIVPGAKNHIPGNGSQKVEPTVVVPPQVGAVIREEKGDLRARIRQAYLNNVLFFLTGEPTGRDVQKTAEEIRARKDEGLLQLSSAYKIMSDEGLDPLVDFVLYEMQVQGIIDPPPQDLHQPDGRGGVRAEVQVEYINNLAAAQKLLGISAVERLINSALGMYQGTQDPSILDNIDFDAAIHLLAETLGVKPSLVRADDVVKAMRDARAKAQQQKAAADQAAQSATAMKEMSQTDPETLDQLGQRFGPYAQSQVRF
jgi:hypothetical protein